MTGYDAVIDETARLTDAQIELDEGGKALLDEQLQLLKYHLPEKPMASFRVFSPDSRKNGGAYETVRGRVKKIDPVARCIVLLEGQVIPVERIYGIEYEPEEHEENGGIL